MIGIRLKYNLIGKTADLTQKTITMRISPKEQKLIHDTAKHCFGCSAKVFLFGSRTDDQQRGGDIDLYVETSLEGPALQEARLRLMSKLQIQMGDQKIDVVTSDKKTESGDGDIRFIVEEARRTGVLL